MQKYKQLRTKDGINLSYRICRTKKENGKIVFLHGYSGNHTAWLKVSRWLEKEGYSTLMYDLRGHGMSDKLKRRELYTTERFLSDLEEVVSRERFQGAFIVGYSAGGMLAMEYSLRKPGEVKKILLISTNHTNLLSYRYLPVPLLSPLVKGFMRILALLLGKYNRKKYDFIRYDKHKKPANYFHEKMSSMPLDVNVWCISTLISRGLKGRLNKIKVPVLMLRGTKDLLTTDRECREMKRLIKNSEYHCIKGVDHHIIIRAPNELKKEILGFISEKK